MDKALRLADELDDVHTTHVARNAAAELRRLHTENEAARLVGIQQERDLMKAKAQRDALLEALKELDSWLVCACIATAEDMAQSFPHMQKVASAAIAAAEGEKT